jgi:putative ATP-dependent endonuclease of OLD family
MIAVEKLIIKNYKCFRDFEINFNKGVSIIVGNNEEGKSTILEALQLCLSGMLNGRALFSDVYESLFNKEAVGEYIESLKTDNKKPLPTILIEVYLKTNELPRFEGDGNSGRTKGCGLWIKICFNEQYQGEYTALIQRGDVKTIPVEYYKVERFSFAREAVTNRGIPLKSVLIDSSSNRFQNGSDVYISKIIRESLDDKEIAALAQSYRKLKENFGNDASIVAINDKVSENAGISNKKVSVSVDMSMKNSWETVLMTFIDDVPFHQIGKGEQCVIKTNLALAHKKAQTSNLVLIEEPENHLSHTMLNELLNKINSTCKDKQLIITTHSNFVANKLNLKNLILLSNQTTTKFDELPEGDAEYFEKLPGYDTLRLILAKKVILVEGPSDELIVQRAYKDKYDLLPIENGVDVISVRGLSFKRFLDIAKRLDKKVTVVTDNDGNYEKRIRKKYQDYEDVDCIKVFASDNEDLKTLEPHFVEANKDKLADIRELIGISEADYPTQKNVSDYMEDNKTEWALAVFNSDKTYSYPAYITEAIEWIHEGE